MADSSYPYDWPMTFDQANQYLAGQDQQNAAAGVATRRRLPGTPLQPGAIQLKEVK